MFTDALLLVQVSTDKAHRRVVEVDPATLARRDMASHRSSSRVGTRVSSRVDTRASSRATVLRRRLAIRRSSGVAGE